MKGSKIKLFSSFAVLFCLAALPVTHAGPNGPRYEVKITNLTRGSLFTPILIASHRPGLQLFELGTPASPALEILAEEGNPVPLNNLIQPYVYESIIAGAAPWDPGSTVTEIVATRGRYDHISVAAMLVPTNDAFFSVNGVAGPKGNKSIVLYSPAYDAGTEANDEICPSTSGSGPCGSEIMVGEGYVHIHAGIQGIGSLDPADHDWRNPVARIEIRRIP